MELDTVNKSWENVVMFSMSREIRLPTWKLVNRKGDLLIFEPIQAPISQDGFVTRACFVSFKKITQRLYTLEN